MKKFFKSAVTTLCAIVTIIALGFPSIPYVSASEFDADDAVMEDESLTPDPQSDAMRKSTMKNLVTKSQLMKKSSLTICL